MHVAKKAESRRPNLFVVGAPKAGTTAMHSYLGQHPEIYMSRVKEPTYFGADLPGEAYCHDEREYLDLFAGAADQKWVGEASPWYMLSMTAAEEIHAFAPDARIVAMLREPTALIESLHASALFSGDESEADLSRALELEASRRSGRNLTSLVRLPQATYYRAVIDFAPQLRRYFDAFGRERVHVVVFDDLARDTAATYRLVLRFLGVDDAHAPPFTVVNSNRAVRSRALRSLYQDPPRRVRAALTHAVPRPVVRRLWTRGMWPMLYRLNTRRSAREPMPIVLRRRLYEETRPAVAELSELLGRDFTELWKMPA